MGGGSGTDGGFTDLFGGFHDGLSAPGEAVDAALTSGTCAEALRVVLIEGCIDAAKDGFEGNSGLSPGLDQGPIEGGEDEERTSALLESGLDLGEVVEVVHVLDRAPLPLCFCNC